MNSLPANNPDWLVKKIIKMGGTISPENRFLQREEYEKIY